MLETLMAISDRRFPYSLSVHSLIPPLLASSFHELLRTVSSN
jgi:hypothetical protein